MPKLTVTRLLRPLLVAACAWSATLPSALCAQERPTIVAVNYALSYFAERLAGADAEVVFPVPAGSDPSFWRPSIAAISTMQQADVILLNGAGFATWTTKASLPRSRIVDTSRDFSDQYISTETVTHSHGEDGEHSHTGTASYIWLDQSLALQQAKAVAAALETRALVDSADLSARLAALAADLEALDAAAARLRAVGSDRPLITTHPRYQYLARAYGLEIEALAWEAGAAPDVAQLAELERLVAESGAAVFLWEAAPSPEARAAVQGLGLTDIVFPPLATNPPDGDYVQSLRTSIDDLNAAMKAVGG